MAHDPANAKQLAQQPKLANLVQAMLLNPDDEGILDNCATVLEAMSKYDQFQEALNTLEYIIVLNNTIQAHMPNEPLVTKAMNILANLACTTCSYQCASEQILRNGQPAFVSSRQQGHPSPCKVWR